MYTVASIIIKGEFENASELTRIMTDAERKILWASNYFYTPTVEPRWAVIPFEPLIPLILGVKEGDPTSVVRDLYNIEYIIHPGIPTTLLCGDNLKLYRRDTSAAKRRIPGTIVLGVNGLRDASVIMEKYPLNDMVVVVDTDVNHHGYRHNGYHGRDLFPAKAIAVFMERAFEKGIPSVVYSTQQHIPKLRETAQDLGSLVFYHSEIEKDGVKRKFLEAVGGNGYSSRFG